MALLDLNTLKAALPDNIRKTVTDEVLHGINAAVADPQFYEYYRNNLLSYGLPEWSSSCRMISVLPPGNCKFFIGNAYVTRYFQHKNIRIAL